MPKHMRVPRRCGDCVFYGGGIDYAPLYGGGIDYAPQWRTFRIRYDEEGRLVGCTWRNVVVDANDRPGRACPLAKLG